MIRLVLIDDQPIVDLGIGSLLESQGFDVVGCATSLGEGIETIVAQRPDVVICDLMFEGEPDGLELMAALDATQARGTPVLMLSSYSMSYLIGLAQEAGAAGFVAKDADPATLVEAIRSVGSGGRCFPAMQAAPRAPTHRELEIIRGVADGCSSDEVSVRLGVTARTVDTHLARMFERYGAASRTQLAMLAVRNGWIIKLPIETRLGSPSPPDVSWESRMEADRPAG